MVDKEVKQNQSSCGFQTENMLQVTDWKDDNFSSRGVSVGAVYYTVGTLKFMKHTSLPYLMYFHWCDPSTVCVWRRRLPGNSFLFFIMDRNEIKMIQFYLEMKHLVEYKRHTFRKLVHTFKKRVCSIAAVPG